MFKQTFVVLVFLGLASAYKLTIRDNSDPEGSNVDKTQWYDQKLSGYNGADEDEIYDNIYSRFSKEGRTPSGHKTGQKLLMKDDAKIAAGTALEAAHFLTPRQVPGFLDANFDAAWAHFDQNHEGWIRYEETHTFQRYLNGNLNSFKGAPGSISDLKSGGKKYPLVYPAKSDATPVGNEGLKY